MITAIILTAFFVNGLQVVTGLGMILEPLRDFIVRAVARCVNDNSRYFHIIMKPILFCAPCMCSIYGTAITLLTMPFTVDLIWQLPIILISSSALAKLLNSYLI